MVINSSMPISALAPIACLLTALSWTSLAVATADADSGDHSQRHSDHAATTDIPAFGEQGNGDQQDQDMRCGGDGHAHHKAMMARKGYKLSEHDYTLVDAPLVNKDGEKTSLSTELDGAKPVIITFVFTTCTTICPVLSGTFAKLQTELGSEVDEVQMISISIDPEYDTPARLRAYAKLFKAGPQWEFLTGDLDDIVAVQKAFNVYRGNKMSHEPTILLRRSQEGPWIRLDGLASATDVANEYRRLVAAN